MLKIMLVDDHEVVRLGIKALLSNFPEYEVVTEASSSNEAIAKARGVPSRTQSLWISAYLARMGSKPPKRS